MTARSDIQYPQAYADATRAAIIQNARKTWAKQPLAQEVNKILLDNSRQNRPNEFLQGMLVSLEAYGKLSEKQMAVVIKSAADSAARKAVWAAERAAKAASQIHIGVVGEKCVIVLTVKHIVPMETAFGTNYLHICEDADGNVVIYKGKANGFPLKGETATVTATVFGHTERDGVPQTVIQRPKVK
jgi:hypothetical protein